MEELPLSTDLSIEEFRRLRPNFNLPSLGKFYITEEQFLRRCQRFLMLDEIKKQRHAEDKNN